MALRLPVILREIFAYLPTEVLLVACSLVNTLWNTEARNFIRDYRRCRIKRWVGCPKNPQHDLRSCHSKIATEYTVLESLVGYDKICEDILGNGRAVPFNYMVLPEHSCCDWDNHCRTDDIVLRNLTGGMKFKYLEILGNVKVNCDCGKEIVRLLMQKCCDVKVLIISAGFRTFENLQILGWVPTFPKLEELDISSMRLAYPPAERDKLMLRWLLHNAPHIKSVRLESEVAALGILPTEILPRVMLVGSLNIDIRTNLGLELLRKACTAQSGLRELRLFGPTGNLREVGLPIERNTVMQFNTCLEQIIHMSHKSLESIRIFHGCTLTPVSHPPLTKLTYLCLDHMIYGDHEVWKAIVGLDFGKTMPVLVKVYLAVETDYEPQYGNVVHAATTVRSLEIRFGSNVTNVWPLPALFPNISDLDCVFKGRGNFVIDIFKNWRHLLDMRLTFDWVRGSTRNHDMDFCGIYEEEAEMLRHQDGVYLAKVHIVPVRPCLVTMLSK